MERKQSPTLKEQKKSSSDKTFEMMGEDICSFVKWENMTLEVPTELGGGVGWGWGWMQTGGLVSGRERAWHVTLPALPAPGQMG